MATVQELSQIRSATAEAAVKWLLNLAEALDQTGWYFQGQQILGSQTAVDAFVYTKHRKDVALRKSEYGSLEGMQLRMRPFLPSPRPLQRWKSDGKASSRPSGIWWVRALSCRVEVCAYHSGTMKPKLPSLIPIAWVLTL